MRKVELFQGPSVIASYVHFVEAPSLLLTTVILDVITRSVSCMLVIIMFTHVLLIPELRSDHQELTDKIHEKIELLHSARLAPRSSLTKDSGKILLSK